MIRAVVGLAVVLLWMVAKRLDDQRSRYLAKDELRRLMKVLDDRLCRRGTKAINRTFLRLRLIVLTALATGNASERDLCAHME